MTSPMDDLMRAQLAQQQTAFARRQQGMAPPSPAPTGVPTIPTAPTLPAQAAPQAGQAITAAPAWMISPPGRPAPREHFNYEPVGDGSWRMFPPGVQAPPWGPQGSMPTMAGLDHLRGMGAQMRQQFGGGQPGNGNQAPAGETPEQALARLSALPGRRVGQYRRAGLTPPPPGGGGGGEDDGGGDDGGGGGGTGGTGGSGSLTQPGPYIPGIPTMANPHDDDET